MGNSLPWAGFEGEQDWQGQLRVLWFRWCRSGAQKRWNCHVHKSFMEKILTGREREELTSRLKAKKGGKKISSVEGQRIEANGPQVGENNWKLVQVITGKSKDAPTQSMRKRTGNTTHLFLLSDRTQFYKNTSVFVRTDQGCWCQERIHQQIPEAAMEFSLQLLSGSPFKTLAGRSCAGWVSAEHPSTTLGNRSPIPCPQRQLCLLFLVLSAPSSAQPTVWDHSGQLGRLEEPQERQGHRKITWGAG